MVFNSVFRGDVCSFSLATLQVTYIQDFNGFLVPLEIVLFRTDASINRLSALLAGSAYHKDKYIMITVYFILIDSKIQKAYNYFTQFVIVLSVPQDSLKGLFDIGFTEAYFTTVLHFDLLLCQQF